MSTRRRQPTRLPRFDYAQQGAYFVTLCTRSRACLFGDIVKGEMRLNDIGKVAHRLWEEIPTHFPQVETDAWVVMPNHVHGVMVIPDPHVGATHASPLRPQHASPVLNPWTKSPDARIFCDARLSKEAIFMSEPMNAEEREILEKFERGDLFSAASAEEEMETARQAARNTFNKTRRVNLRVTERDFNLAHARAREEGIPYQTLLSSVIHKYLSGRLTEKP